MSGAHTRLADRGVTLVVDHYMVRGDHVYEFQKPNSGSIKVNFLCPEGSDVEHTLTRIRRYVSGVQGLPPSKVRLEVRELDDESASVVDEASG